MAKRTAKKPKDEAPQNGTAQLMKELWQAAVSLRGSIEPADHKRYVLPIVLPPFLSLRNEPAAQNSIHRLRKRRATSSPKTQNTASGSWRMRTSTGPSALGCFRDVPMVVHRAARPSRVHASLFERRCWSHASLWTLRNGRSRPEEQFVNGRQT